ncbi:hypothetical protein BEP19_03775 [Ammoniphilus oxalaticus]|uniref:Uncharacterized protein n=1 Tax=Ammoniphilus oxalaticus TaxID=66863 RepID=A0A419SLS3_9BACL|nr:hypothetical protein [Ammoniphilus oxalaticus]RKD24965.1 hypothetical protein BEP19_03775 [Ammoniphilus oxalaticus]
MKKRAIVQQTRPRLTLWSDANFSGNSLRFRGDLGVRNLITFGFNDVLSSLQLEGGPQNTLVLFEDVNYQGRRKVYRGPVNVSFLSDFNDVASSFIISRRRLSNDEIRRIQRRGRAPGNFAEILKRTKMKKMTKSFRPKKRK